jgi:hypothetical protein
MKKTTLFAALIGLGSISAFSQLKVNANGSIHFVSSQWPGGVKLETAVMPGNFNMPTLYPAGNWWGALGTNANWFGFSYIDHIYSHTINTITCIESSDSTLKENIVPLETVLGKINKLNGYSYNFKESVFISNPLNKNVKNKEWEEKHYGFLAQELQQQFPDLVKTTEDGTLGITYSGMIPVLLEAIKEQQIQIEALKYQVAKQDKNTKAREEYIMETSASHLVQNSPNPFTTSTEISYFASSTAKQVTIMLFDMAGNLIKTYDKLAVGEGKITVDGGELNAGMFMYSLIIDGVELDTKRMILTK